MQDFEQLMNLYHGIFVWCGAAAILFLILAAALFILLKIPQAFGELTGRVAKKAIAEMVELSSESGGLTSRKIGEDGRRHRSGRNRTGALGTSKLRRRTGSLSGSLPTDKMGGQRTTSMELTPGGLSGASNSMGPVPAYPQENISGSMAGGFAAAAQVSVSDNAVQTGPQSFVRAGGAPDDTGARETTALDSGALETTALGNGASETTALDSGALETTVLSGNIQALKTPSAGSGRGASFVILRSIVEVHTDEVMM